MRLTIAQLLNNQAGAGLEPRVVYANQVAIDYACVTAATQVQTQSYVALPAQRKPETCRIANAHNTQWQLLVPASARLRQRARTHTPTRTHTHTHHAYDTIRLSISEWARGDDVGGWADISMRGSWGRWRACDTHDLQHVQREWNAVAPRRACA